MTSGTKKILFLLCGLLSLVLAFIGTFLPVLPTTPFVLLAAWCFSRSSESLHQRILASRLFGPLVKNWRQHGVIRTKAKILSTLMIVCFFSYTLVFVPLSLALKIFIALVGIAVLIFILTRPGRPAGG